MKRIVLYLIAIMTMITVNAQTLTERQKGLAACACLMAQGDLERLEPAVRMALDNGVTINELKEAFSQLYAYTGFRMMPRRPTNWAQRTRRSSQESRSTIPSVRRTTTT